MAKKQTGNKRYSTRKTAGEPQNKRRRLRRILFSIAAFAVVAATIFFLVLAQRRTGFEYLKTRSARWSRRCRTPFPPSRTSCAAL